MAISPSDLLGTFLLMQSTNQYNPALLASEAAPVRCGEPRTSLFRSVHISFWLQVLKIQLNSSWKMLVYCKDAAIMKFKEGK